MNVLLNLHRPEGFLDGSDKDIFLGNMCYGNRKCLQYWHFCAQYDEKLFKKERLNYTPLRTVYTLYTTRLRIMRLFPYEKFGMPHATELNQLNRSYPSRT